MFVACAHCDFLVAVLGNAASQRCPRCDSEVDVAQAQPLDGAVETEPDSDTDADENGESVQPDTQPSPGIEDDATTTAEAFDTGTDAVETTAPEATSPDVTASAATAPARARRGHRAPSFARRHAQAPARPSNWRWWLAVCALGLLLVLQMLLAQRRELAATAQWRPVVSTMCAVLQCELPPWREPAAFTMLERSVQPKAGTAGVLHVTASFRNDARWPQPWPTVVLVLSDMDGRQVGQRAFKPDEYRAAQDNDRIVPGQSASIRLDVIEPAQQVVAFSFDFQ